MPIRLRTRLASLGALVCGVLASFPRTSAACSQGAKLDRSCTLDLVVGPVLASSRIVAFGGAYQAIAEGLDGYFANSAAPAVRAPWSRSWFEWDIDLGVSLPGAFSRVDFENRPDQHRFDYGSAFFLTLGANLQLGAWGVGVAGDVQRYNITSVDPAMAGDFYTTVSKSKLLIARQLIDGDLVIGGGLRLLGFGMTDASNKALFNLAGVSLEVGALFRPEDQPFRIGATYRADVTTGAPAADASGTVAGYTVPGAVHQPWELDVGVALQAGRRPLNFKWVNPHDADERLREETRRARAARKKSYDDAIGKADAATRKQLEKENAEREKKLADEEDRAIGHLDERIKERQRLAYAALSREFVLLTFGMLVVGPTSEGVSFSSFFQQTVDRAGRVFTVSLRAGLETEVVPGWVRTRVGTYVEPSRFSAAVDVHDFRQHVTAGFDVRLVTWSVFGLLPSDNTFRITALIDLAPRWTNWGLSIGTWH